VKVLVCGSRDWCNEAVVRKALTLLPVGTVIIHGGARGADTIADTIARALKFEVRVYPADWIGGGKAAGPIRNSRMLREQHPDEQGVRIDKGIAFSTHFHTSRGTLDMATKMSKENIPVTVYDGSREGAFTV